MKTLVNLMKKYITVVNHKCIKNEKHILSNSIDLKIKLFVLVVLCGVITAGIIIKNIGEEMIGERALNIAQAVAESIDSEKYYELTKMNKLDHYNNYTLNAYYDNLRNHMIKIKKNTQVKYLYSITEYNDEYYRYIVDGSGNEDDSKLGYLDSKSNFCIEADNTLKTGEANYSQIYNGGEYGNLISGFAPVINDAGEVMGIVGCDISAENLVIDTINHMPLIIIGTIISALIVVIFALINGIDIINRSKAEEKMEQLAYYDNLTGLPNKNMLNDHFNRIINTYSDSQIGILFIDMDRFKIINDSMGYAFGDRVLQKVSQRLIKCISENNVILRYGGDEFILIMQDIKDKEVKKVSQNIIHEFTNSFIIDGQEMYITPSIGISMYPSNGKDIEELVKYASIAMRYAKEKGRNNYKFYNYILYNRNRRKMLLEKELRNALKNNEFILKYQPQYNLDTGEIVGVEALIRWNHPKLGMISPGEFIPLAEETGLIIPIGNWVLKNACIQNKKFQLLTPRPLYMAVNVSAIQFQDKNFVNIVKHVLEETKLEAQYLHLEITESLIQNVKQLLEIMNQLKRIGVKVSIDDFGTGFSSLSVIQNIPVDTLKIDQSFVNGILVDSNTPAIIKTIIDMANNLKLGIVAEGIENTDQVDFLKENKCQIGQGYYFSFPVNTEEIMKKLSIEKEAC